MAFVILLAGAALRLNEMMGMKQVTGCFDNKAFPMMVAGGTGKDAGGEKGEGCEGRHSPRFS